MMEGEMFRIIVPGSTANLGPGFDSVGLALNRYLTLEVERSHEWKVIPLTAELMDFPRDKNNFIMKVAKETAAAYHQVLPGCTVKMNSDIPLAKGLGSSAAAIVAGIELANTLCQLQLTKQEKLSLASKIEGHPDNVGASLLGGLVISCLVDTEVHAETEHGIHLDVIAAIPKDELLTKDSRSVLPKEFSYDRAVKAGAIGNMLIAALIKGNYALAGKMMKADLFHHPYRKELVPHLALIEELAPKCGAYGAALSGAGPTVLCIAEKGKGPLVVKGLADALPQMEWHALHIDNHGSRVLSSSSKEVCS